MLQWLSGDILTTVCEIPGLHCARGSTPWDCIISANFQAEQY